MIFASTAASAVNCAAVIAKAAAVPDCVIEVIFALFDCKVFKFVAMFALVSVTVSEATFVSVPTVPAFAAVTPVTTALKLANFAVKVALYCAAVSVMFATVPVWVMLVSLPLVAAACSVVIFAAVPIFAAVSDTVKLDTFALVFAPLTVATVIPVNAAVKLLNFAVNVVVYWAAVNVTGVIVPVSVIVVSLVPKAINAVRLVVMFAAVSETDSVVTWVLATTAAVPEAATALTAKV